MSFTLVPLGELVTIAKGRKAPEVYETKVSGAKRYIQINDLRNDEKLSFAVDSDGVEVHSTDLCIAWDGANAGTVGYGLSGFIGSTISRLRPKKDGLFITPYVGRFIQSKFQILNESTTGATIPHVSKDKLTGLKIPLPPLPEQLRIAAILDKADAIRRKRQEAIQLTDDLLCSVFIEMFGDPVTNPKGWPIAKFSSIGKLDRGKSKHRPRNAPELLGGPYPLIQTGDVANSDYYIRNYKSTYSQLGLKQSKIWPTGTLCITIAANIAKTGILTFEACFPDSVVGFTPNKLATTEYVQFWLGFLQKILEDSAPESAQKNINLEILRNLDIPLPPIGLQNQFAQHVKKIEVLKGKLSKNAFETETLFNSLMQHAFQGGLIAHDESAKRVISLLEPTHVDRTDTRKVVSLKRAKNEREESTSAEAKRHAGHDMYNKAALAAYIVSRCHDPAEPMGRVKLAKLFYLVQRKVDLTLTESFTRRAAGPLDDAIHKFLPFAQKNNWLVLLPQMGMKKPVGPGGACEDAVKQTIKYLGEKRSAVDEVLDSLKDMKGHTLECWATVDVVAEELSTSCKSLTVRNILQALAASPEWRPKLEKPAFSELNIAAAVLGLRKLGFVTTG